MDRPEEIKSQRPQSAGRYQEKSKDGYWVEEDGFGYESWNTFKVMTQSGGIKYVVPSGHHGKLQDAIDHAEMLRNQAREFRRKNREFRKERGY